MPDRRTAAPRTWEAPVRSPELERLYRQLMTTRELAAAPEITLQLLSMIDGNAPTRDVASLLARDQALTARLLRLANSAFFGVRARVTSVPQAITLLGLTRVRDITLALSFCDRVQAANIPSRSTRQILWTHSAAVAVASRVLAEALGTDAGLAYAAGLLHDIGKLVLGFHFGERYWGLLDTVADCDEALAIEEGSFGCHHGTVGGWLLQVWGLLPSLVAPVALHHTPLLRHWGIDLTTCVSLADRLASALDAGGIPPETFEELSDFAPGLLNCEGWQNLTGTIAAERDAIAHVFAS